MDDTAETVVSTASASESTAIDTVAFHVESLPQPTVQSVTRKKNNKAQKTKIVDELGEDEPLVDTTTAIPKNSKKTRRLQRQQKKKEAKSSEKVQNFLQLPGELLMEILGHLRPSDVFQLSRLNKATREFIEDYEVSIANDIIEQRYWVLRRCFVLPRLLADVDSRSQAALFHPRREKMIEIHKKPYQHVRPPDNRIFCTCASCMMAWNNLNVALDLSHFQGHLDRREPIPMIPRGTQSDWNPALIEAHANVVEKAVTSPLIYASILEKHLETITGTLLRQTRRPPQPKAPMHRHNKPMLAVSSAMQSPPATMLYGIVEADAAAGDDRFLERPGKESYEFPWHRDNYYNLLAYVPMRKWSKLEQRWMYYAAGAHERDLEWARKWFLPAAPTSSGG